MQVLHTASLTELRHSLVAVHFDLSSLPSGPSCFAQATQHVPLEPQNAPATPLDAATAPHGHTTAAPGLTTAPQSHTTASQGHAAAPLATQLLPGPQENPEATAKARNRGRLRPHNFSPCPHNRSSMLNNSFPGPHSCYTAAPLATQPLPNATGKSQSNGEVCVRNCVRNCVRSL